MHIPPSKLDNPDFAWGRYKRLMRWMVLASLTAVVLGLGGLYLMIGPIPIAMAALTAGGVFFAVLLAAALMGLVFLSSSSGHDETIEDPFKDQE